MNLTPVSAGHLMTRREQGVLTITMNRPGKLNGWTMAMMNALKEVFEKANGEDSVKAVILTGAGNYYSAGVNLSGTLKLMPPRKLRELIAENNQALFDVFLGCTKPLLIAVNGPAIGASVTSATLANGIIAADNATFSTPFAALGVTPEGCSSVHLPRLIGEESAQRMLGAEGWKPDAQQALAIGLIQDVAPQTELMERADYIVRQWLEEGKQRELLAGSEIDELRKVNADESQQLADAFLKAAFLKHQAQFLWRKKKFMPSMVFWLLWGARPLWKLWL
ncbi:enoyl-CoA hydratase/isomerase family protein [Photobacterium sp. ZSDE20]|uniref:Enoyl-CoA hydratase/isomerase family protein n=1 Tax=Photobacterium pectinilyticum TaxID=2906793 RepID=A0ABT1N4F9_9GAMM|nr:enoyl-CoA hydratase/isomerase family protein [Photobacterium sp. ZSDE20]MCQ1058601.1 enoyl-CoA hydratase/isomerase family protein [Photobacterium sp. ZSDE20]MDD1826277.1 enoyl-CoA hydratase/isomerase family protein [Photobacterium sp. ZSDE20]